jgi:antitoxin CptB
MKELDHLLVRWLEREWPRADAARRAAFAALLDAEDDRLWYWFTGKERPPEGGVGSLVDEIRADAGL